MRTTTTTKARKVHPWTAASVRNMEAREAAVLADFKAWARDRGLDVRTRDDEADFFATPTFYAWLGYAAASNVRTSGGAR